MEWRWLLVVPVVGVFIALVLGLFCPDYLYGVSMVLLVEALFWLGYSLVLLGQRYRHWNQYWMWFQKECYTLFLAVLLLGISEVLRCWIPTFHGNPSHWLHLPLLVITCIITLILVFVSSASHQFSNENKRKDMAT